MRLSFAFMLLFFLNAFSQEVEYEVEQLKVSKVPTLDDFDFGQGSPKLNITTTAHSKLSIMVNEFSSYLASKLNKTLLSTNLGRKKKIKRHSPKIERLSFICSSMN